MMIDSFLRSIKSFIECQHRYQEDHMFCTVCGQKMNKEVWAIYDEGCKRFAVSFSGEPHRYTEYEAKRVADILNRSFCPDCGQKKHKAVRFKEFDPEDNNWRK